MMKVLPGSPLHYVKIVHSGSSLVAEQLMSFTSWTIAASGDVAGDRTREAASTTACMDSSIWAHKR
jgi:hypothetical protein